MKLVAKQNSLHINQCNDSHTEWYKQDHNQKNSVTLKLVLGPHMCSCKWLLLIILFTHLNDTETWSAKGSQ